MLTIPTDLLPTIVAQAPAAVGEIAFSIAVDRSRIARNGVFDSVRPGMTAVPTPDLIERAVAIVADEIGPDEPTIASHASPDGAFTITFIHFPGEAETDAYVIVDGIILHTRNVGSRPFDLFSRTD